MKNYIKIAFLLLVSCVLATSCSNGISYDQWERRQTKDKFGELQDDFYYVRGYKGTYSDNYNTNEELTVVAKLDESSLSFMLLKKNSELVTEKGDYLFEIKNSKGEVKSFIGFFLEAFNIVSPSVNWENGRLGELKCADYLIDNPDDYTILLSITGRSSSRSKYIFKVNTKGFRELQEEMKK